MKLNSCLTITCSILITTWVVVSPVKAQLPTIQNLEPLLQQIDPLRGSELRSARQADNSLVSACIWFDGRCVFKVAALKSDLKDRIDPIQERFNEIARVYLQNDSEELRVIKDYKNDTYDIYVIIGDKKQRLMNVTNYDGNLRGATLEERANQISEKVEKSLKTAKLERQPEHLIEQGKIAGLTALSMLLVSLAIANPKNSKKRSVDGATSSDVSELNAIKTKLIQRQKVNLRAVKLVLLSLAQVAIWVGGILFILGLFPYTRIIQLLTVRIITIPFQVGIVGLATYTVIRLGYAAIAKFNSTIANHSLLTSESDRRLQLRIATISVVARSIVTISCMAIGILIGLDTVGINIAPILAGAGIIGIAVSFASQSLIKDTINGFLIILEDQYAVGDVIKVGEYRGLVENINLRITQLRDAEGKLITIPNSEIKVVANLSSNWARADLNIPVAYQTDVNEALKLVTRVAEAMSVDESWKGLILEPPQVLGVDNFGEGGVIIKVWIKTQPLQQWVVSREFRRRIKEGFDRSGIPIHMPQQQVWYKRYSSDSLLVEQNQDDRQL